MRHLRHNRNHCWMTLMTQMTLEPPAGTLGGNGSS
jgi:hypothetical protein